MKLPNQNKSKSKANLALELFRALPESKDEYSMQKMRGNINSRILMITPPCDTTEYHLGLPFSNNAAEAFHQLLLEYDLSTQDDFLIISCSRYGLKPNKASTNIIREYVMACAKHNLFDFYVCVGEDSFKFIFGAGKKPSSATLLGSLLFTPEAGFKPLFTFPPPSYLAPTYGDNDWENRKLSQLEQKFNVKFRTFVEKLAIEIKKVGIK